MDGKTDGRTENRTPISHLAKAGATKISCCCVNTSDRISCGRKILQQKERLCMKKSKMERYRYMTCDFTSFSPVFQSYQDDGCDNEMF